jgi:hypothetical protein
MAVNDSLNRRIFDRRLYAAAAVLFAMIVLAGFARTYYLREFFDVPALPSLLVHVHGLVMTAWVALFGVQVWLISSKRIRVHQRLGYTAIGLAVLIIVVGFFTAAASAKFGSSSTPPGIPPLSFMVVPMFDLLMFAILFGGAIYYRKRPADHKRLMLLTAINFLPPAVARIPYEPLQSFGPLWFFGLPTALALLLLILDSWRNRRLNKVFLVGSIALIVSYPLRLILMGTGPWLAFAAWVTGWAA